MMLPSPLCIQKGLRMKNITLCVVLAVVACSGPAVSETRKPSEVLHDIAKGRLEHLDYTPDQVETAFKPLLANIQTRGLSDKEDVALGLAYFFSYDGLNAKRIFAKYRNRNDLLGRVSWQAQQNMSFAGDKDYALVERRTFEFRRKYKPIPEDLEYTGTMVRILATKFARDGDHARAAGWILNDLRSVPINLPFRSYDNLGRLFDSFKATGRTNEAVAIMEKHLAAMKADLAKQNRRLRRHVAYAPIEASLAHSHRQDIIHFFPFTDGLWADEPGASQARVTAHTTARAIELYSRWVKAAKKGEPLTYP